eukprot:2240681-Pyramimonas_sp.AAC.1
MRGSCHSTASEFSAAARRPTTPIARAGPRPRKSTRRKTAQQGGALANSTLSPPSQITISRQP